MHVHDPEPDLDNANVGMLAGLVYYMITHAASGIGRRFFACISRAMCLRADIVLAQMDVKRHMASNTTEELKAPKVVSAL